MRIDWRRGSWTGSLNRYVQREVREHMRSNATARRARYSISFRALRRIFCDRTFGQFIVIYTVIDIIAVAGEFLLSRRFPEFIPSWTFSHPQIDIKSFLTSAASILITAQVGVLGVISIAIGLVTLIAQREGSSSDVQVYYHESLAFEVVASSIALLAVLCAQLYWPLQFLFHQLGGGTQSQVFKLALSGFHLWWLLLNLSALAHFVSTTFQFVQQRPRAQLRERYIANAVLPIEMTERLRHRLYSAAGLGLVGDPDVTRNGRSVFFGANFGPPAEIEIECRFPRAMVLHDVRMRWVQWALQRWARRCQVQANRFNRRRTRVELEEPILWFTPHLDSPLKGRIALCCRRRGIPLGKVERWAIRWSFRFRRAHHEA